MRWLVALLILVSLPGALLAQGPAAGEGLVLNFRDAEIGTVVETIARATGQRFVHDTPLAGRVTLLLEDEVGRDEALEVLNAALLLAGYAAIPGPDGTQKILPIDAGRTVAPWLQRPASPDAARLVTTWVRLEAADAVEMARILGQETRAGLIVPYPPTNGLIIAVAEDRLPRMLELVRALDQASATQLVVLPLRYADATATAAQLEVVFKPGDGPEAPLELIVDERTNSLVVSGARERVAAVRRYLETVDVPKRSPSGIHVVRIANADAEELASQLQSIELAPPGGRAAGSTGGSAASFSIVADPPTNSLVIRAEPAVFGELARLITELDRVPPRVGIEAYVWDIDFAANLDLGFDALVPVIVPDEVDDTAVLTTIGDVQALLDDPTPQRFLTRFTRKPILLPVVGPDGVPIDVVVPEGAAQITADQSQTQLRALARPFLLAASGEEQEIFSGDQVPIPVSSGGETQTIDGAVTLPGAAPTTSDPFITSQSIERQDVGVNLRVKPIAVSDDLVVVEVRVEVKTVDETANQSSSDGNDLGPDLRQLQVETKLRLVDGAVVLFASAPQDALGRTEIGVPFLKEIPILGWFFRSTRDVERRRRLVTAIQVTEIHTPEEQRADTIIRRLALERHTARTLPLRELTLSPYAVLVATRGSANDAQRVAQELASLAGRPVIVPWTSDGEMRWDVYLVDFDEISALGALTAELRQRGFITRLEVVAPPPT